jgi:CubicO group peptidase (beta-lactamase class C family)
MMTSDQLGSLRWSETSSFGYGFRINRVKNPDGTPGPVIDLGWGGVFSTWFSINPGDRIVEIIGTQVFSNPFESELNSAFDKAVKSALTQ